MIAHPGPRWCLAPESIAAVDRAAIDAGLPGAALMESAGRGVVEAILERWPAPGRACVWVGGGNNGGDGLVVARYLAAAGWRVEIAAFVDPGSLAGDAALQWRLVEPLGLEVDRIEDAASARAAAARVAGATCLVDALLGTGLAGEVREPMRGAIEALADVDVEVVAVDAPSGLDGTTGAVRGAAPSAALTVTFGFPKPGLFLADGPERAGTVHVVPLGYPAPALSAAAADPLEWIGLDEAERALPPRRHDAHKGAAGRLLIVAGSDRYRGAALLTARAAVRSGVGLCVVAAPEPAAEALLEALPEAIVVALPADGEGRIAAAAADRVAEAAAEADALALGPGLGRSPGVRAAVEAALASDVPAVVDADALNVLADDPGPARRDPPTALTPHPGELGRWLDRDPADVDADRIAAAREAARRWGATVALKGSPTVVAAPEGRAALNLTGNPGLATGGSGDVLTGLLGSLLAQGVGLPLAARAGVFLHGLAADWAVADRGERGFAPGDLFAYLPLAIREVAAGDGGALLDRLDHPRAALLKVPDRERTA